MRIALRFPRQRTRWLVGGALLAVLVSPVTILFAEKPAAAEPKLVDLGSVEDLRVRFNEDAGKVRLVLLLSPT